MRKPGREKRGHLALGQGKGSECLNFPILNKFARQDTQEAIEDIRGSEDPAMSHPSPPFPTTLSCPIPVESFLQLFSSVLGIRAAGCQKLAASWMELEPGGVSSSDPT